MKVRPTSVTVIAWLLIVMGVGCFFLLGRGSHDTDMTVLMAHSFGLLPVPISIFMVLAGLSATIVSGIGMLKRQNWARILYIILWGIDFLVEITTSPTKLKMIPNLGVFLVIVFFLFRPKANQYFLGAEHTNGSEES